MVQYTKVKMKYLNYFLGILCFCFELNSALAQPENIPYFNPYQGRFEESALDLQTVFTSNRIIVLNDATNHTELYQEIVEDLAEKVEKFLTDYTSLLGVEDHCEEPPIYFILSEKLKNSETHFEYHAFYCPLYFEKIGHDVIFLNPTYLTSSSLDFFLAHELFHLFDKDRRRDKWVSEGLAQLGAYLLTHQMPRYQITQFFAEPFIGLEEFPSGESKYYGHSFLFFYYLYKNQLRNISRLRDFIECLHPQDFFSQEEWTQIFKDFSLNKLSRITPLLAVPENIEIKEYMVLYIAGSEENKNAVEKLEISLKEQGFNVEVLRIPQENSYTLVLLTTDQH